MAAGTIFGYGDTSPFADRWSSTDDLGNTFDIQTTGDNLFVYCVDADELPNFLFGFSNNGPWLEAGLSAVEYGTGFSALPEPLSQAGSLFLSHGDNCVYSGPVQTTMEKAELQQTMIDTQYFDCINGTRYEIEGTSRGTSSAVSPRRFTAMATAIAAPVMAGLLWSLVAFAQDMI